jgi:hypothetical protein
MPQKTPIRVRDFLIRPTFSFIFMMKKRKSYISSPEGALNNYTEGEVVNSLSFAGAFIVIWW